jgi:hypothetical protein
METPQRAVVKKKITKVFLKTMIERQWINGFEKAKLVNREHWQEKNREGCLNEFARKPSLST